MASQVEIRIQSYFGKLEREEHHRYRSWEHCYRFFQRTTPARLVACRDEAALHLGFFLASWGMYRGGSFLLQRDYTAHLPAVECLAERRWLPLWNYEFGAHEDDIGNVDDLLELRRCLGTAYAQFGTPTDTLVTKIMLGTLGCFPACDRYFIAGFKSTGRPYSAFNRQFIVRVFDFCRSNLSGLRSAQAAVERTVGIRYPLMKLVDMYFFQTGLDNTMITTGRLNP